jgi:hypothetical protein
MNKKYLYISILIVTVMVVVLSGMGRIPFCKCGVIAPWSSDVVSNQQSQQLADPYSFTHVIHGIIFYALLWLLFGKKLSPTQRLLIAIGIESAWEIIENTDFVINRYREATISLDYYGDSIFNSVGDVISMFLGYLVAWKLPKKFSVGLLVAIELGLLYFIRDNLTINIIMLIHPVESIKVWQAGMNAL